jgi:hypothetical protein
MIDLNKEYKTQGGQKVKLMGIHKDAVIGIILWDSSDASTAKWGLENGIWWANDSQYNLVEVKHPITHSAWVNVYENGFSRYTHLTRESADIDAQEGRLDCIELKYETII